MWKILFCGIYAMGIQDQIDKFSKFPYETKKAKVVDMLNKLKWTHDMFATLYAKITAASSVSEEILLKIYQWIFEIAAELEKGNTTKAQEKLKHMSDVLLAIKQQEEMEMAREGNPDDMLKNL